MKKWYHIAILLLLLGIGSCSKEATLSEPKEGQLHLTLQSGVASRAEGTGDGVAADGGGMVDLTLVLIDPLGAEVARKRFTALTGEEQRCKRVEFSNLNIGNYTLYAYANTQNNSVLASDANASQQRDDTFTALSGRAVPEIDGVTPMLLTAQRIIPIGVGTTEATIDLLRPIVSFAFELHNHSNVPITVTDLSFSNFNSSTSYILPHDGAIPAANTYRPLPAYEGPQVVSVKEAANSETTGWKELYHIHLFENRAASYTFDMALQVTRTITATEEVIGSTAITAPVEETRYVIRQQGEDRYVALDASNDPTTVTTPLGNERAYWYFIPNGNGYRLQNIGTGRYLRYNNGLTTTTTTNQATTFTYTNNRLSFRSGQRTYYLRYNNDLTTTTSSNSASSWQLYTIEEQTTTREQTDTHTISERQLMVIDRATAAVSPMSEQLRNQQIRVVINAYINDTNGTFNFEVVPWEERSADITFGEE